MAKLDLDLINTRGEGRPVPTKMDLNIIKYVISKRKREIEANPSLFQTERWDHSDVFYAGRTHLNKLGWDTSVYNDSIGKEGTLRRKAFYGKIKSVCEDHFGVKRHQIGIYPEDRAVIAFNGNVYSVGFDEIRTLMHYGTDVIVVEKQGTVIKMVPFTKNIGIAFIQSQGFVSEYGTALAQLCNGHGDTAINYTDRWLPKYEGHLGVLTDCDSSGVVIGLGIKNAIRIGIDLDTITEMNKVNSDLGIELNLELEDLQESTRINTHWISLDGILHGRGKVYEGLSYEEMKFYSKYLSKHHEDSTGDTVRFINYLEENRIELNTILAAAKPEPFWNWLRWKILQLWPNRDYRRGAIYISNSMRTPIYNRFEKWYDNLTKPIIKDSVEQAKNDLAKVDGLFEDVDGFEDNVNTRAKETEIDIVDHILMEDEKIQKIDLGLESIMKQHGHVDEDSEDESEDNEE